MCNKISSIARMDGSQSKEKIGSRDTRLVALVESPPQANTTSSNAGYNHRLGSPNPVYERNAPHKEFHP
jgi:hypothetical protein